MNVLKLVPNQKAKLPEEIEHSRPLDVHKWSDFKHVSGVIDVIWDELFASRYPVDPRAGNRSKSDATKQIEVLFLDLYVAWLSDPTLIIGIG